LEKVAVGNNRSIRKNKNGEPRTGCPMASAQIATDNRSRNSGELDRGGLGAERYRRSGWRLVWGKFLVNVHGSLPRFIEGGLTSVLEMNLSPGEVRGCKKSKMIRPTSSRLTCRVNDQHRRIGPKKCHGHPDKIFCRLLVFFFFFLFFFFFFFFFFF